MFERFTLIAGPCVLEDDALGGMRQDQFTQVAAVSLGPGTFAGVAVAVAQEECLELSAAASQILDGIGAGAAQIAHGFVAGLGHMDRGQFAGAMQARLSTVV